jgi:hypothetical protein
MSFWRRRANDRPLAPADAGRDSTSACTRLGVDPSRYRHAFTTHGRFGGAGSSSRDSTSAHTRPGCNSGGRRYAFGQTGIRSGDGAARRGPAAEVIGDPAGGLASIVREGADSGRRNRLPRAVRRSLNCPWLPRPEATAPSDKPRHETMSWSRSGIGRAIIERLKTEECTALLKRSRSTR